jgi:hypothetical protein
MEVNVEKTKAVRISWQPYPIQIMTDQKQPKCGIFYLDSMKTNYVRCTHEIKPRTAIAQASYKKKKALFTSQTGLKFKEETSNVLHLEHSFV